MKVVLVTVGVFPEVVYPYDEVHALMLYWEDNDFHLRKHFTELEKVLPIDFDINVNQWAIPSISPAATTEAEIYKFKQRHSRAQSLLIVYYCGHGYIEGDQPPWSPDPDATASKTVDWHNIQIRLERTESDVVILLDTCHSGATPSHLRNDEIPEGRRTEIIAELRRKAQADRIFTVAQLHHEILDNQRRKYSSEGGDKNAATPVCISSVRDWKQTSIPLKSMLIDFCDLNEPENPLPNRRRARSRLGECSTEANESTMPLSVRKVRRPSEPYAEVANAPLQFPPAPRYPKYKGKHWKF